ISTSSTPSERATDGIRLFEAAVSRRQSSGARQPSRPLDLREWGSRTVRSRLSLVQALQDPRRTDAPALRLKDKLGSGPDSVNREPLLIVDFLKLFSDGPQQWGFRLILRLNEERVDRPQECLLLTTGEAFRLLEPAEEPAVFDRRRGNWVLTHPLVRGD